MKYGNEYTIGDVTLYRVGNRWIQADYDDYNASWHTYDVRDRYLREQGYGFTARHLGRIAKDARQYSCPADYLRRNSR